MVALRTIACDDPREEAWWELVQELGRQAWQHRVQRDASISITVIALRMT